MKDIGAIIERQRLLHKLQSSNADDFAYNKYHTVEEIHAWIDQMVQTYPDLATSFTVGQSYEKRVDSIRIEQGVASFDRHRRRQACADWTCTKRGAPCGPSPFHLMQIGRTS